MDLAERQDRAIPEHEQGHRWLAALCSAMAGAWATWLALRTGGAASAHYALYAPGYAMGVVPATYFGLKLSYASTLGGKGLGMSALGACIGLAMFLVPITLAPFTPGPSETLNVPAIYLVSGAAGFVIGLAGAVVFVPLVLLGFAAGVAVGALAAHRVERAWIGRLGLGARPSRYKAILANALFVFLAWLLLQSSIPAAAALAPAVAGMGGAAEAALCRGRRLPRLAGLRACAISIAPLAAALGMLGAASAAWRGVLLPVPPAADIRPFPAEAAIAAFRFRIERQADVAWEGGRWQADRRQKAWLVYLSSPSIASFPSRAPLKGKPYLVRPDSDLSVRGDGDAPGRPDGAARTCRDDGGAPLPTVRISQDAKIALEDGNWKIPCEHAAPRSERVDGGYLIDFASFPGTYGRPPASVESRISAGIPMCLVVDTSRDWYGVRSHWFLRGSCRDADGAAALAAMRRAVDDMQVDAPTD